MFRFAGSLQPPRTTLNAVRRCPHTQERVLADSNFTSASLGDFLCLCTGKHLRPKYFSRAFQPLQPLFFQEKELLCCVLFCRCFHEPGCNWFYLAASSETPPLFVSATTAPADDELHWISEVRNNAVVLQCSVVMATLISLTRT